MNQKMLKAYISAYKQKFDQIKDEELYKWKAIKHFQQTWNPSVEENEFTSMLDDALSKTSNLLSSGNYFAKRMIKIAAKHQPATVQQAFADLFDEEKDLQERIEQFRKTITTIISRVYPEANPYQDDRAILVYLTLRYPEDYFLYKFRMFKNFCLKVDYDYVPKRGAFANIQQYMYVCELLRNEIVKDNELLMMHAKRLENSDAYLDSSFNILTQDVIFAVSRHLQVEGMDEAEPNLEPLTIKPIKTIPKEKIISLKPQKSNHEARQRRNKKLGDLGERLVFQHERKHCKPEFRNKVRHVSVEEGDGLGYDILSVDDEGNEKYIEVKTTKGNANQSFFVTANELGRSKTDADKFFLYRLFHYNEEQDTADYFILKGDLSSYCMNPVLFQVALEVVVDPESLTTWKGSKWINGD